MSKITQTGEVTALSAKGHGVVKSANGRTYFIAGAWPGDRVSFTPQESEGRYAQGALVEILLPSPDRREAACPHLGLSPGECSGCPWMIASYESQLLHKQTRLAHALEKRGLPTGPEVLLPIWGSPSTLGHRNRAQIKTDGRRLGFVSEGTNLLAPVEDCLALNSKARQVLASLKASLPREDWLPGQGYQWNYIDIDEDMLPGAEVVLNRRRPFRQANNEQNHRMREWIQENLADVPKDSQVLELFCGSGNFTEVIAAQGFSKLLAVEVAGPALEALKAKNLPATHALGLDLYSRARWSEIQEALPRARALVLDPPRQGLMKKRSFFQHFPDLNKVLYISCDTQSFAVDAVEFIKRGWHMAQIRPVDQFPHTPHVEILSVFVKCS